MESDSFENPYLGKRHDGRDLDQIRTCKIYPHWTKNPEGSVLIECGETRVMCTASWKDEVPKWRSGQGLGWVSAEYAMLPRSTGERLARESVAGRNSRSQEISRLVGRALRMAVDFKLLGEHAIYIDCDVLQADGGTRAASITGGWVALREAVDWALENRKISRDCIRHQVSAVSVGITDLGEILDLDYLEDCSAFTDMNVAQTENGDFVEVQGTGEKAAFSPSQLSALLDLASKGNEKLRKIQKGAEEK